MTQADGDPCMSSGMPGAVLLGTVVDRLGDDASVADHIAVGPVEQRDPVGAVGAPPQEPDLTISW
jgi:hypothetical protein